jgi:teichuronic acid biosynthesis glycosyltransferase TuaC
MRVLFLVTRRQNPVCMNTFIFSQGESLRSEGVKVEYFFLHGPGPFKYMAGIHRLRGHLKNNTYDLIHAHYSYNGYVAVCQKACPVVVSLMGSDVLEKYNPIRGLIENYILGQVMKKAGAVLCKTRQMMDALKRDHNVHLVPNGVDLNFFRPFDRSECRQKLNLSGDKRYVLFAANPLRKEKNFALAEEVVRRLQDPSVELLTVYREPQEKLLLYYNAADVLLLTSHYEGSPNVVKEALACGLPVVSTKVGDVAQLFEDCGLGRTSDANPERMTEVLKSVLKGEREANNCPGIEKYHLQMIAGRIKAIYGSLLAMQQTGNA